MLMLMWMLSKSYCIEFCLRHKLFIQTQSSVERKVLRSTHWSVTAAVVVFLVNAADFQFERQLNHLAFHMVFTALQFVFSTSFSKMSCACQPHHPHCRVFFPSSITRLFFLLYINILMEVKTQVPLSGSSQFTPKPKSCWEYWFIKLVPCTLVEWTSCFLLLLFFFLELQKLSLSC